MGRKQIYLENRGVNGNSHLDDYFVELIVRCDSMLALVR